MYCIHIPSFTSFDLLSSSSSDLLSSRSFDLLPSRSFDLLSSRSFDLLSSRSLDLLSSRSFDLLSSRSFNLLSSRSFDLLSSRSFDLFSSRSAHLDQFRFLLPYRQLVRHTICCFYEIIVIGFCQIIAELLKGKKVTIIIVFATNRPRKHSHTPHPPQNGLLGYALVRFSVPFLNELN